MLKVVVRHDLNPSESTDNLGKITEIWSRLIFFVYCSLNLNTVIVLLPRKQREKRTRSRISRSRRDLQWTEMDMSETLTFEPRHENKSCSACPNDQHKHLTYDM